MGIVEFLRARLDEDEAVAHEAIEERRKSGMERHAPDYDFQSWPDISVPCVVVGPERVLREVEAKRRIASNMQTAIDQAWQDGPARPFIEATAERVLRHLASVYVDHEDFQSEWR